VRPKVLMVVSYDQTLEIPEYEMIIDNVVLDI
jgi:hypothetical protein